MGDFPANHVIFFVSVIILDSSFCRKNERYPCQIQYFQKQKQIAAFLEIPRLDVEEPLYLDVFTHQMVQRSSFIKNPLWTWDSRRSSSLFILGWCAVLCGLLEVAENQPILWTWKVWQIGALKVLLKAASRISQVCFVFSLCEVGMHWDIICTN
jgi:hypothetical protein